VTAFYDRRAVANRAAITYDPRRRDGIAMSKIRDESAADREAIREVNRRAFGGEAEARLVDRLRDDETVVASLVAVDSGIVVGHVLFSELPIETPGGVVPAAALAPLAVVPERQRQGIGSALVWRGLEACRARGRAAVVVLGHPGYYPRFGFAADLARSLRAPYAGEAFMALELVPGSLAGGGTVRYPDAFSLVD
jgi:putative acetyltransferase